MTESLPSINGNVMCCTKCGWTTYYVVRDEIAEWILFICIKCKETAVIQGGTYKGSFPKEALSKDLQLL